MKESRLVESFDGTNIAYRVYGSGATTVLFSNGIGCNQTFFTYLIPALSDGYRVVVWDYRGHLDSERPGGPDTLTVQACVDDAVAVMEAADIDEAVFGGFSMGVQISLEVIAQHPERARGLLALCGPYENPLKTFFHIGPAASPLYPLMLAWARAYPDLATWIWRTLISGPWAFPVGRALVFNEHVQRKDLGPYLDHLASMHALTFLEFGESLRTHSARDVLPTVDVPTLILAGTHDNFTPVDVCRRMHELIPGSEWLPIEGGTHATPIEFPDQVCDGVRSFLDRHFAVG